MSDSDKAQKDLYTAIYGHSVEGVKKALEAGADPSLPDSTGSTPLRLTILLALHPNMVTILDLLVGRGPTKKALLEAKSFAEKPVNDSGGRCMIWGSMIPILDKGLKSMEDDGTSNDYSFKTLLFSKKYADVHFLCNDGEIIHAHKCVLGEKCAHYFDKPFSDHWNENKSAVIEFKPEASSPVMKAVIAFIYTGSLDLTNKLVKEKNNYSFEILDKAGEYGLSELIKFLESYLKHTLSIPTFKETLFAANQHDLVKLKATCFDFIQENWWEFLLGDHSTSFHSIAQENPELWNEMSAATCPNKRRKMN